MSNKSNKFNLVIMKKILVKYLKGSEPEGQAADWMTEQDWENHREFVEKCKKDGSYGKEVEDIIELEENNFLDNPNKLILDFDNVEKFEFKPLNKTE